MKRGPPVTRELDQVVDQHAQLSGLGQRGGGERLRAGVVRLFSEQFEVGDQAGEGCAQLMRGVGHQPALRAHRLLKRGRHRGERLSEPADLVLARCLDRRAEIAGGPDPLDGFGQPANWPQHPARGQPCHRCRDNRADRHERDEQPAERRLGRCRVRRRLGGADQHAGSTRELGGVNAVDDAPVGLVVEVRLVAPVRDLDVMSGDGDEPVRRAGRDVGQDLQLRATERNQLAEPTGLLELRRQVRGIFGHLYQRLVVLSLQVRADHRINNRRHDGQRAEDDRPDGDHDPGAQAHFSSRST